MIRKLLCGWFSSGAFDDAAKSLPGKNNRQYPSRMSRPRDCTFRRASSKNSKEVFPLLQLLITILLCSMFFKIRALSAPHQVPAYACYVFVLDSPTPSPLASRGRNGEKPKAHRSMDVLP